MKRDSGEMEGNIGAASNARSRRLAELAEELDKLSVGETDKVKIEALKTLTEEVKDVKENVAGLNKRFAISILQNALQMCCASDQNDAGCDYFFFDFDGLNLSSNSLTRQVLRAFIRGVPHDFGLCNYTVYPEKQRSLQEPQGPSEGFRAAMTKQIQELTGMTPRWEGKEDGAWSISLNLGEE
uniref:Uncharacterized protein n=1 Tax=Chromera velia CCMP2878 TaxID=1169474 RepID=A0A0G4G5E0_9ALVE|mmetsp:Transcript_3760/g.7753  ORF Transcript_3760/g.7753 Transcript_3760/m.7753 type:complete len:183 (+) Transcript_3760:40-588(+)|eukprot:Cvel_540.t1-p1 / transcript=Cvel_540.t1 / gene=Cvel_540 / organism=Chromera_velia_CCMP2878 / gene_product=hypothetical protein / transcript_product=hypothetical protein / location=Cvel_scaffold17:10511-11056(+) / protein_length=182 / sequence_SO=supercontig / SO=protein_coding / is_pseudo=false